MWNIEIYLVALSAMWVERGDGRERGGNQLFGNVGDVSIDFLNGAIIFVQERSNHMVCQGGILGNAAIPGQGCSQEKNIERWMLTAECTVVSHQPSRDHCP